LLVDDEESIQLLYREEFEDEGYIVDSAYNGDEALAKFRENPPDLVLLDINMPGLNGIEVLRQMKECAPPAHYPQFGLSGV
jgi:two-component system, response regulator, stage 0 sporulation protein F